MKKTIKDVSKERIHAILDSLFESKLIRYIAQRNEFEPPYILEDNIQKSYLMINPQKMIAIATIVQD